MQYRSLVYGGVEFLFHSFLVPPTGRLERRSLFPSTSSPRQCYAGLAREALRAGGAESFMRTSKSYSSTLPPNPPLQPILRTSVIAPHDLVLELDAKGIHLRLVRVALPGHTWTQKRKDGNSISVDVIVPEYADSGSSLTGVCEVKISLFG
jgi:hypothetical protein